MIINKIFETVDVHVEGEPLKNHHRWFTRNKRSDPTREKGPFSWHHFAKF